MKLRDLTIDYVKEVGFVEIIEDYRFKDLINGIEEGLITKLTLEDGKGIYTKSIADERSWLYGNREVLVVHEYLVAHAGENTYRVGRRDKIIYWKDRYCGD